MLILKSLGIGIFEIFFFFNYNGRCCCWRAQITCTRIEEGSLSFWVWNKYHHYRIQAQTTTQHKSSISKCRKRLKSDQCHHFNLTRLVSLHSHQSCSKIHRGLVIHTLQTHMKVLLRLVTFDLKLQLKGLHLVSQQKMIFVVTIFLWGSTQLMNQLNISRNLRNSRHKVSEKLTLKIFENTTMILAIVTTTILPCTISYTTNNMMLNCWDKQSRKTKYKNRFKISVKLILWWAEIK